MKLNEFCKNCGAKLTEDSKFCNQCGTAVVVGNDYMDEDDVFSKLRYIKNTTNDLVVENNIEILFSGSDNSYNTKLLHMNHLKVEGYINDTEIEEIRRMILNNSLDYNAFVSHSNSVSVVHTSNDNHKKQYKDNKKIGVVTCPKCGSSSITTSNKKISVGKGVAGAVVGSLVNPVGTVVGAAVGATHSKKIYNVCMNCGHRWKP